MYTVKTVNEWINENYLEKLNLKKGKLKKIDPEKYPGIEDDFYELISIAYKELGGHIKVKSPSDINKSNWNYWSVTDIDGDQDVDIVIFGKKGKYGVKYSGVGHDGSRESKREYVSTRAKTLKLTGYYGEVSKKFAEILLVKYDVPVVSDKEEVEKVLKKDIEWHGKHPEKPNMPGDGWYSRKISGSSQLKILVGRPK